MMAHGRPRRRRRRQRRRWRRAGRPARTDPADVGSTGLTPDFDVDRRRRRPGRRRRRARRWPAPARAVVLLERGPFPGSKNMYGGVVYGRVLDGLIPRWWEEAPIQRWVTRRSTMVLTEHQALTVDFRTEAWGEPPYNGATALPPRLRPLAGRQGRGRRRRAGLLDHGHRPAAATPAAGSSACAPTAPTATSRRRSSSPATASTRFLAKEAGLYHAHRRRALHARRQGGAGAADGRDRRALRRARPRGRRHRDPRLHRAASPAAGSSTPTSTPSRSAWC